MYLSFIAIVCWSLKINDYFSKKTILMKEKVLEENPGIWNENGINDGSPTKQADSMIIFSVTFCSLKATHKHMKLPTRLVTKDSFDHWRLNQPIR